MNWKPHKQSFISVCTYLSISYRKSGAQGKGGKGNEELGKFAQGIMMEIESHLKWLVDTSFEIVYIQVEYPFSSISREYAVFWHIYTTL